MFINVCIDFLFVNQVAYYIHNSYMLNFIIAYISNRPGLVLKQQCYC